MINKLFVMGILMLSLPVVVQSDNSESFDNTKQTKEPIVNGKASWDEAYEEFRKKWALWKEAQK